MLTLGGGLFLWVATAIFMKSHGAPITCEAGTYVLGQSASVTCNFRTDVSASKSSFNMARYSSDAPKGDIGNDIIVCHWSEVGQKHDCTETEGYKFKNINQQYVRVEIPKVTDEYAGLYTCFFVPSQGKDTHACQLFVRKKTLNDTTPMFQAGTAVPQGGEDHTFNPTVIAVIGVSAVVGIMLVCIIAFIVWRRRQKKNRQEEDHGCTDRLIDTKEAQMKKLLEGLKLPKKNLEAYSKKSRKLSGLMVILERELKQGLDNIPQSEEDNTPTSVRLFRLYCPLLNQLDEPDLLVVDLGCTILTISFVQLRKHAVFTTSKSCMMKTGTGNQMFSSIAESINNFVVDKKRNEKDPLHAAIIFPFPCHQTSLQKASLGKCTREFCCEDIVNKDIHELLQNALQKIQPPCKVNIVAIVNDVVSTLMSVAHKTPECKISLTVGTGFNACFVEQWRRVGTNSTEDTQPEETIYNTELGALGENGCLTEFRTDFDKQLDDFSSKPGSQIFEKMVSWTYIGDIVRLALKRLRQDGLLLPKEERSCKLFQQGSITSDHVAIIDSDTESPYQKTRDILTELDVTQYTDEELKTISYVCRLVCERATYLTAAALATLINHLNQSGVMVVVDGELNKKLPRFGEHLYNITNKLVKPELQDKFLLVSSNDRRNVGAALIARASMRQEQAAASSHSSQ